MNASEAQGPGVCASRATAFVQQRFFRGSFKMAQGVIKKLVADRGFGFISGEGADVFFHFSALVDTSFEDLQEGESVEYDIENDGGRGKGPRAVNVRRTGG
jgi:CspA family cold shock protein